MLKVETGFKIKLTPQFQDWRDKNYFSPQNQNMLKKFSCLAVRNVNLENHMHFLPYWQFCHFSRTIYNQFQSTRKRNSFSSLLNFSRGKTSEIQNLDLMKFLNVQQSRNFFGARRTYMVRAPSVTIELDNSTHARYHTI